jgi:hypothetical protein
VEDYACLGRDVWEDCGEKRKACEQKGTKNNKDQNFAQRGLTVVLSCVTSLSIRLPAALLFALLSSSPKSNRAHLMQPFVWHCLSSVSHCMPQPSQCALIVHFFFGNESLKLLDKYRNTCATGHESTTVSHSPIRLFFVYICTSSVVDYMYILCVADFLQPFE